MFSYFTKIAFRNILRFRAISIINLVSLTFGFCCFISATLLSNYLNSFDQSFPHAERIYTLVQTSTETGTSPQVATPVATHLRSRFPDLKVVRGTPASPMDITIEDEPKTLKVRFVDTGFFNIFPLPMMHGVEAGSDLPPNSVIITERAAKTVFGTTNVVGKSLRIGHQFDVTIAGVSQTMGQPTHIESALNGLSSDLIAPVSILDRWTNLLADNYFESGTEHWGNNSFYTYILFPPNQTVDEKSFQRELDAFAREVIPPPFSETLSFHIQPINKLSLSYAAVAFGGVNISSLLFIAGCLVGIIGAINYSNLVVAQLALRSQEIGMQKIMGAKRAMLVLQYSYETLLFVLTAVLLSLLACFLLVNTLVGFGTAGISITILLDVGLWTHIVLASLLIVAFTAAYPTFRTSCYPLISLLNSKGGSGKSGHARSILTGSQFMISGALIILSLVMLSQNQIMTQQLDGAMADPKVVIRNPLLALPVDSKLLASEFQKHPGIISSTTIERLPWSMGGMPAKLARSPDVGAPVVTPINNLVGYDFAKTVELPLLAGRSFDRNRANDVLPPLADITQSSGPYAVIIDSKTAVKLGWNEPEEAVGQVIYYRLEPPQVASPSSIELLIIGIAGKQRHQIIDYTNFGLSGAIYSLQPDAAQYMVLRVSKENTQAALRHIDAVWKELVPGMPLQRQFVDELFYENYLLFLRLSSVITGLTVMGLFLAGIGLLGNAAIVTGARQKEIAIRKVMGASSSRLLRMLLIDFCKPVMVANVIAWPLAYLLSKFYVSLFAEQTVITWTPFVVSFVVSISFVCLTVLFQAWQGARARPAPVLQYE